MSNAIHYLHRQAFDVAYHLLSEAGSCDAVGSAEYERVWNAFVEAGYPPEPAAFIVQHANEPLEELPAADEGFTATEADIGVFSAAIERLQAKYGTMRLDMSFPALVGIIATLQLGLRHPGNVGETSEGVRHFLIETIDVLGREEPELKRCLMAGFNPACDVPREKGEKDR